MSERIKQAALDAARRASGNGTAPRQPVEADPYPEDQRGDAWEGPDDHHGAEGDAAPQRPVQPYREFPVGALPQPLQAYCREGGAALGCDPALVVLPVLSAVASAIGNSRTIRLKHGWEAPCILWTTTVAESGSLKSPAWQLGVGPLYRIQRRLREEYLRKKASYEKELADWKEKVAADPDAAGEQPEKPVFRRVVVADCTIEKLADVLEDNPRGLLLARDELAGWLGSFSRYKGKAGGTDLPNWLEAYRAGQWIVDRKTGPKTHYYVPRAAVSICGTIQPGVLSRALTQDYHDAGLAARLLMAMPPSRRKQWTEVEIAPETRDAYERCVELLLALEMVPDDGLRPFALHLDAEAKERWIEYYNEWAGRQHEAEGNTAAMMAKMEEVAARLALLHHVVSHVHVEADDKRPVGGQSMEAGITLARWFAAEAERVYGVLAEGEESQERRLLAEWIARKGGTVTARELQTGNRRYRGSADIAEAALEELVKASVGRWVDVNSAGKGGRPSRAFRLVSTVSVSETP